MPAPQSDSMIAIVDDDPSVREGLSSLIRSVGLRVETFVSAQEFLSRSGAETPSCLVLDLQMPGLSGLDLQKQMAEAERELCITLDAYTGTCHEAPGKAVYLFKEMKAACETLAERWPAIKPPKSAIL